MRSDASRTGPRASIRLAARRSDDGVIEGYASLFERVDLAKDVIEPGAFRASSRGAGRAASSCSGSTIRAEPIGALERADRGFARAFVRGQLSLAVARARGKPSR